MHERLDAIAVQEPARIQEIQLDHKARARDHAAQTFDQRDHRLRRAAGAEEIVDDKHSFARLHRVLVDMEGGCAVFERVILVYGFPGEFAGFPDGDDAPAHSVADGGGEHEAARFGGADFRRAAVRERVAEPVDCVFEGFRIVEEGRDVFEDNAFFGKIRNGADDFFEFPVIHVRISGRFPNPAEQQ